MALDNFDCFVETLAEKIRCMTQLVLLIRLITDDRNEMEHNNRKTSNSANASNQQYQHTTNKKRRRAYETTGLNIQPYMKKTKLKKVELLSNDDPHGEI